MCIFAAQDQLSIVFWLAFCGGSHGLPQRMYLPMLMASAERSGHPDEHACDAHETQPQAEADPNECSALRLTLVLKIDGSTVEAVGSGRVSGSHG